MLKPFIKSSDLLLALRSVLIYAPGVLELLSEKTTTEIRQQFKKLEEDFVCDYAKLRVMQYLEPGIWMFAKNHICTPYYETT